MRVLVATDLSAAGMLSIEALIGCNPELFDGVTLLHVIEADHYMAGGSITEVIEWAEKQLAEEANGLADAGFMTDWRVEQGPAADIVQGIGTEIAADLIVVTDRGKGGAAGRLLGSTAERIAQAGEIPVLVERVEERDTSWCRLGEGSPFTRPLVAADLDDTLRRLAVTAGRLPGRESIRVVHVASPGSDLSQAHAFIEAETAPTPIEDSEIVVTEGRDPAEQIMAEAQASDATVIVLAPRRHGVIGRLVFGSVAIALLRESRIPLLFA